MSPSIPRKRASVMWEKEHLLMVSDADRVSTSDILLIGDSIIFQFSRYPCVWAKHFKNLKNFNMGMRGDRTQHVLWRIKFGLLPANVNIVIIHAGTNNLLKNKPFEVAEGILQIGHEVRRRLPNSKIVMTGLLPRGLKTSRYRDDVNAVNNCLCDMLKPEESLLYLKPSGWTLPNGDLRSDYYFKDGLHLIKGGYHHFSSCISDILSLKPTFQSSHLSSLPLPAPTKCIPIHVPAIAPVVSARTLPTAAFHISAPKCQRRHRRRYQSPPPSSEDEDEQTMRCVSRQLKFIDFRLLDKLGN